MLRLLRLAARLQVLRQFEPSAGNLNQLNHVNSQRVSQSVKQVYTSADGLIFDATDRCAVDLRIDGQDLLRHPPQCTQSSEIPSDAVAPIHEPQASNLARGKPSDIFDIFRLVSVLMATNDLRGRQCASPS